MIAVLSCDGKTPDDNQRFTILVEMGPNACLLNFTILVSIGSRPYTSYFPRVPQCHVLRVGRTW